MKKVNFIAILIVLCTTLSCNHNSKEKAISSHIKDIDKIVVQLESTIDDLDQTIINSYLQGTIETQELNPNYKLFFSKTDSLKQVLKSMNVMDLDENLKSSATSLISEYQVLVNKEYGVFRTGIKIKNQEQRIKYSKLILEILKIRLSKLEHFQLKKFAFGSKYNVETMSLNKIEKIKSTIKESENFLSKISDS